MSGSTSDWRVTEGPAIGTEPIFDLSDIVVDLHFFVTGGMSRSIYAKLATTSPTRVESTGSTLSELEGQLQIHDGLPEKSYPGLYPEHFGSIALGQNRGVLALPVPDMFIVHLYLPPEQFAATLSTLVQARGSTVLRMEIDRTLDQALPYEECFFWNDILSPVILFNEFGILTSVGSDGRG
jgi:hypothetical protein